MLKLISKDGSKNVWLVGPTMRIGSSRNNEIILSGTGIATLHGYIHIDADSVIYEPIAGQPSYINEEVVNKKTALGLSDTLRLSSQEFSLSDPQSEKRKAPTAKIKAIPSEEDSESTVFRQVAVPEASGWMIQGLHPSLKNKRFPVDGTEVLGRSSDCELSFSNDRLSRKHAQFKLLDGVLFIKDLDSSNGVFHNGEKVSQAKLANGDTLAFDKLEFTVIAPKVAQGASAIQPSNNNETVVRSAITPDMIKEAQAHSKAKKAQPNKVESDVIPELSTPASNTPIIIGVLIVVGIIVAAALVL